MQQYSNYFQGSFYAIIFAIIVFVSSCTSTDPTDITGEYTSDKSGYSTLEIENINGIIFTIIHQIGERNYDNLREVLKTKVVGEQLYFYFPNKYRQDNNENAFISDYNQKSFDPEKFTLENNRLFGEVVRDANGMPQCIKLRDHETPKTSGIVMKKTNYTIFCKNK